MSQIRIRFATKRDAETLSALGARTFSDTFRDLYPPDDLAEYLIDAHAPGFYADWAADPDYGLWIAERDGEAVAYALAGPCHLPHPEVTADCGELWRLYVRQDLQGSGLGGRLLALSLDWLKRPGRRLWIGVWSGNHGAQRLYARHGFEKVGDYEFPVGRVRDHEFILARPAPDHVEFGLINPNST